MTRLWLLFRHSSSLDAGRRQQLGDIFEAGGVQEDPPASVLWVLCGLESAVNITENRSDGLLRQKNRTIEADRGGPGECRLVRGNCGGYRDWAGSRRQIGPLFRRHCCGTGSSRTGTDFDRLLACGGGRCWSSPDSVWFGNVHRFALEAAPPKITGVAGGDGGASR